MAHIELSDVSLTFRVRQQGRMSLKEFLVGRKFRRTVNPILEVQALRDVSFRVEEGERLGVLGAGDLAFQAKARQRMKEMIERARLLVLVSHDLSSLSALCERGIWLDHGRVRQTGPIREVIAAYKASVQGPAPGEAPPTLAS